MSRALSEAIVAAYDASAVLKAAVTMWSPFAPEGQNPPFVTFIPLAGTTEGTMDKDIGIKYLDIVPVQFTVFVDEWKLNDGWDIIALIRTVYDNNILGGTLSDGRAVKICKRLSNGIVVDQPEGGFGIALDYQYTLE